jgi:O-methyltransferase domain
VGSIHAQSVIEEQANRLLEMIAGGWLAQAIFVAAKLKLADHISDNARSAAELASATGAHATSLNRVLRLLASRGIFRFRPDGRYEQTDLSKGLCSSSTISLRNFALLIGDWPQWQAWGNLLDSVMTGQSAFATMHGSGLYDFLQAHPDAAAVFDAAITDRARQENAIIRDAYQWPVGTIVDIGGGQGSLLAAILAKARGARGILFEVPHVADKAKRFLEERELLSRCEVVAGDAVTFVPPQGDIYLMRRVLHGMSDDRAERVLQNCRAAMGAKSQLLIIEHVLAPDNAPSWGQMLDVQMLVLNPGGKERTQQEFESLLQSVGLAISAIVPTEAVTSLIIAGKPSRSTPV